MNKETKTPQPIVLANFVVVLLGAYLVVTSTFFPLSFLSPFDAKRIAQLFLIAILFLFTISWKPLRIQAFGQLSRLTRVNGILLACFFALGIMSSLRLSNPAYALADVAMLFLLACLIVITAASRDLDRDSFDKLAIVFLTVLGLAVFIQELMGFIAGWVSGNEFSYDRALIHFAHPRFYNQLQTLFIPIIAILPVFFPKKAWLKPASIILLGLQWFLVIAFAARGTVASLLIATIFITLWLPKSRQLWLKTYILGLLAGIVIYFGFLMLNDIFIPKTESGAFLSNSAGRSMMHTSGRSMFWNQSITEAIDKPWLGSGPSHFACDSKAWVPAHPHSFPIQVLGEWGIPATIFLSIFVVLIGLRYLKHLNLLNVRTNFGPNRLALSTVLAISLLAGLIHSCLSGVIVMPASQMALVLICGWILSLSSETKSKTLPHGTTFTILLVPAAISLFLILFAIHELKHMPIRMMDLESFGRMTPRFWQEGRVCEYFYERD